MPHQASHQVTKGFKLKFAKDPSLLTPHCKITYTDYSKVQTEVAKRCGQYCSGHVLSFKSVEKVLIEHLPERHGKEKRELMSG